LKVTFPRSKYSKNREEEGNDSLFFVELDMKIWSDDVTECEEAKKEGWKVK